MLLKTLHSRRTCLIVQVVWHVEHCGCCSCLCIKEWVSLLWPIRNRVPVTCSFRDFRKAGHHSLKKGLTWNSLLLKRFSRCILQHPPKPTGQFEFGLIIPGFPYSNPWLCMLSIINFILKARQPSMYVFFWQTIICAGHRVRNDFIGAIMICSPVNHSFTVIYINACKH